MLSKHPFVPLCRIVVTKYNIIYTSVTYYYRAVLDLFAAAVGGEISQNFERCRAAAAAAAFLNNREYKMW